MAFVGLRVPHDAARLLEGVKVPGDRLSASDMHVTILYLGKGLPMVQVAKAMVACSVVTEAQPPFGVSVSRVSSFPRNKDDGFPVICPVDSPELHSLRSALRASFQKLGVPFSDKWPEFRPHVTMSYVKDLPDGVEGFSFDQPLPGPLSFTALELTIWGGDKGDGRVHVGLPFVLSPLERMASRLSRLPSPVGP